MLDSTLESLCQIPHDFHARGDVSFFDLLEECGFPSVADKISTELLAELIRKRPAVIEEWLGWSQDQRSSDASFFRQCGSGTEIAYLRDPDSPTYFSDPPIGCATYILQTARRITSNRVVK
jgi:hypothetical protein